MKKRPAIPRLDGGPQTILLVEDLAAAIAFYGQALRLEQCEADDNRFVKFDSGDGGELLLLKRDGSIAPMAADAAAGANNALTFLVDESGLGLWKGWLTRRGVAIDREAKWVHGGRSLFVRDPDGRRIEFKTPGTVKPPTRPPMPVVKKDDE
ncbi:MAG: hypothetical protein RLZZ15_529 [Verrucomicrobiota bacterium]|jgi:catechol 2,3-dioxygenase-like lactoylglutathione lyase family enzyme